MRELEERRLWWDDRLSLVPRLRGGVGEGLADGGDEGEDGGDESSQAPRCLQRRGEQGFEVEGAGDLGQPADSRLRLRSQEDGCSNEAEKDRENLCAEERALEALEVGV